MPTLPFNFTYNLNTEDAIENEYLNLIGPSSDKKYEPNSHFFVDHLALSDASTSNLSTDAFGPVDGNETDQYRTTSFVRSSASTKVYAICAGKLLIQPQTEDATKVNLILKPAASASYAPLKIKYFIYRGVNKSDLLSNETNLKPVETDSPNFLRRIWDEYIAYHTSDGSPAPTEFPSSLIGYDITNQPGNLLIDKCIFKNTDTASYEVPSCEKGEHLGNFSGRIGLDIVLDYGDYELTNQEELFQLNLEFARKSEHIFDITTIPNSTATRVKRYKEHIHQFLDASALWGSHIDCGIVKIIESDSTNEISTNDDIFNKILKKYQTKNKLYVYVQGERARSYNYYDNSRKIYGFDPAGQLNETYGWPILIEELSLTTQPQGNKDVINFSLEYSINNNVDINYVFEEERHILIDVISPNNNISTLYPKTERPTGALGVVGNSFLFDVAGYLPPGALSYDLDPLSDDSLPSGLSLNNSTGKVTGTPMTQGVSTVLFRTTYTNRVQTITIKFNILQISKTSSIPVSFQINTTKSCSTFLLILSNVKQEFPIKDYFNELWPANLTNSLKLPPNSDNSVNWLTYDKSRLINLDDTLGLGAVIQNKVFFDNGLDLASNTRKSRRLFIAALKRNSIHDYEHSNYNIDIFTSGLEKTIKNKDDYFNKLYNDRSFSIYRGYFQENNGDMVSSLTLINEDNFLYRNSYFQLGITEEEYNKLVYDDTVITENTPQYLPKDADNIFFFLEEDFDFIHENVRKFRLGLQYEDIEGNISDPLFPSSENKVSIYTIDGFFFSSKEFSNHQEYHSEFANALVEFRTVPKSDINPPVPKYNGEFGFDWLRIDEPWLDIRPAYKTEITGGYKRASAADMNINYPNDSNIHGYYYQAYKSLKQEYKSIPTRMVNEQYFIPYLNLFSKAFSNTINTVPAPPFEADLRIFVDIGQNLNKLEFDFDTNLFTINPTILSDNQQTTVGHTIESQNKTVKITCLQDFSEPQQIRILAYPIGVTDKKNAQLAGIIIVNKNDNFTRKEAKIALIGIKTDIQNTGEFSTGSFMPDEKESLYNILHQNLMYCKIVDSGLLLDLDNVDDFEQQRNPSTNQPINSGFISELGRILPYRQNTGKKVHQFLSDTFLDPNKYPAHIQYANHFLIFSFDNRSQMDLLGHVAEIGDPLVVMYRNVEELTDPPRSSRYALSHEAMHGYSLYHTQPHEFVLPAIKYLFYLGETDNVMSYSEFYFTLWQWQREFIKIRSK